MYDKIIKFKDLEGKPCVETFWFNISTSEMVELEAFYDGGSFSDEFQRVLKEEDRKGIVKIFTTIIRVSYGQRHPDGKQFVALEAGQKAVESAEDTADNYSEIELREMPQDKFDKLVGTNPLNWSPKIMQIAYHRKSVAGV